MASRNRRPQTQHASFGGVDENQRLPSQYTSYRYDQARGQAQCNTTDVLVFFLYTESTNHHPRTSNTLSRRLSHPVRMYVTGRLGAIEIYNELIFVCSISFMIRLLLITPIYPKSSCSQSIPVRRRAELLKNIMKALFSAPVPK